MDFKKILDNSKAGKQAREEIQREGQKLEKEFKVKSDEVKKLEDQLERESMVMSKEKREEHARDIRIKKNDLKSIRAQFMENMRGLEAKKISQIEKEVTKLVKEFGEAGGYTIILDRTIGGVVYSGALDVTDEIIKQYDKSFSSTGKQ